MTPEQRRRNHIVGLILLGLVLVVFAWTIFRAAFIFTGFTVN